MIVSQDFGGNEYSKNIRVTIPVRWLCHKNLKGISTAKISVTTRLEYSRKTLEGISVAKIAG